ncbi:hypothetical protein GZL_03956 [Streptomyces sp. 769]|nr:hypothetical protein GZL_03956 [Streptomyces sp. 769]
MCVVGAGCGVFGVGGSDCCALRPNHPPRRPHTLPAIVTRAGPRPLWERKEEKRGRGAHPPPTLLATGTPRRP